MLLILLALQRVQDSHACASGFIRTKWEGRWERRKGKHHYLSHSLLFVSQSHLFTLEVSKSAWANMKLLKVREWRFSKKVSVQKNKPPFRRILTFRWVASSMSFWQQLIAVFSKCVYVNEKPGHGVNAFPCRALASSLGCRIRPGLCLVEFHKAVWDLTHPSLNFSPCPITKVLVKIPNLWMKVGACHSPDAVFLRLSGCMSVQAFVGFRCRALLGDGHSGIFQNENGSMLF